jgi:hypothetical protein
MSLSLKCEEGRSPSNESRSFYMQHGAGHPWLPHERASSSIRPRRTTSPVSHVVGLVISTKHSILPILFEKSPSTPQHETTKGIVCRTSHLILGSVGKKRIHADGGDVMFTSSMG